ncbi:cysteine hydrolase family protein [Zavarzinia sp. CC-PAN008]|uniref:cysteine hydrolase family protein n=1 Tax=Zavarzinia sp. CC-PAN008 TaxID=3243332 RepID=UPI003F743C06
MTPFHIAAEPYDWPHDGRLAPRSTALLVIDMQRDFCDEGGYVSSMGYDLAPIRTIVPRIVRVREALSQWGALVVQTREGHRPDLSDLPSAKAWRSRRAGIGIGGQGPLGRLLIRGEAGWDIIPELAPQPGEVLVDKAGYSAFHATDLERILKVREIRHLVLCGVTTDVCVHSTLRDATDRGYECLVVRDACAATVEANHQAALNTIETEGGIFGALVTSDALCAALGAKAAA